MFCTMCGRQLASSDRSCPDCGAAAPQATVIKKNLKLLSFFARPVPFLILIGLIIGGTVWAGATTWRRFNLPDPADTVESFYAALADHKKDKALEFVSPDQRELGLGFNIELLLQPNVRVQYSNLKFKTIEKTKTEARVRITGEARITLEGRERSVIFNDVAHLLAVKNSWYLDYSSLGDLFAL